MDRASVQMIALPAGERLSRWGGTEPRSIEVGPSTGYTRTGKQPAWYITTLDYSTNKQLQQVNYPAHHPHLVGCSKLLSLDLEPALCTSAILERVLVDALLPFVPLVCARLFTQLGQLL